MQSLEGLRRGFVVKCVEEDFPGHVVDEFSESFPQSGELGFVKGDDRSGRGEFLLGFRENVG